MINPNLFRYDDGVTEDTTGQTGLGIQMMGREQNRQRRAAVQEQNWNQMMQPGQFGPLRGLSYGLGLGGSPGWDGYFGAMQGKENAAAAQGGQFDLDLGSWGPQETSYSWSTQKRMTPEVINGLRQAGIRFGGR